MDMKKSLAILAVVAMMALPGSAFATDIESHMTGNALWSTDSTTFQPAKNSRMVGKNLWKSQADGSSSITSKMVGKSLYKQNVQTAHLAKKVAE